MKMFKKIAAAFLTVAMAVTMFASAYSVSAAGIASSMLTDNQRKVYDQLVKTYITEFKYGSTNSFSFWFKDSFEFDETEEPVATLDVFLAVSMFVADYAYRLPWIDYEGVATEGYNLPFVGASVNTLEATGIDLNLVVVMFAVKEEYRGNAGNLFGYGYYTIKDGAEKDYSNHPNMALNATVTVDSIVNDNEGNERADLANTLANDGDYSTRWQSNAKGNAEGPGWIALDLGEEKTFDKLRIYWETSRANIDGYTIEYSNDGANWTAAKFVSKERSSVKMDNNDEYLDNIVIEPVTAKHVRIYITAMENANKDHPSVYEFEVYNGEIPEAEAEVTGIAVTKAPDKNTYYAGTYPYADLTGMELTVTYSDGDTEVLNDTQIEALRGYGSTELLFAFVDDYASAISISYLGFETSTPVNIVKEEAPVSQIEVISAPTGEGMRGITFKAYSADFSEETELTIPEDAKPIQSTQMMGITVETYVVEYKGENYLAIGLVYEGGGMLEDIFGGEDEGEGEDPAEPAEPAPEEPIAPVAEEPAEPAPEEPATGEEGEDDSLFDLGILKNGFKIITFMGCIAFVNTIPTATLTLTEDSTYIIDSELQYVGNVPEGTTVGDFKKNFVEDVRLTDFDGNVFSDDTPVETCMAIQVRVGEEYSFAGYIVYLKGDQPIVDVMLTLTEGSKYTLDNESLYIFNVSAGETVGDFKKNFVEDIQLEDDDENICSDDSLVGTGMWLDILIDGDYVNTYYQAVIKGDVNGDGKVNSTDFMQIRKNFLGLFEFEMTANELAADADGNGVINSTDFMRVRKHFLGTFDLYKAAE